MRYFETFYTNLDTMIQRQIVYKADSAEELYKQNVQHYFELDALREKTDAMWESGVMQSIIANPVKYDIYEIFEEEYNQKLDQLKESYDPS